MDVKGAVMGTSFTPLQRCSEGALPIRLASPKPYSACKSRCSTSLSFNTFNCRLLLIQKPLMMGHRRSSLPTVAKEGVERTYVMVKPDGVQRGIVGEVISRFERKGFSLKGLKLFQCPTELAQEHYIELKEKPFFAKLIKYILSGPVVCMAWEGPGVVASARKLIGTTNPLAAEPGTIRGDLAIATGRNVVHGSDSSENGEREIALWFKDEELMDWEQHSICWLRE